MRKLSALEGTVTRLGLTPIITGGVDAESVVVAAGLKTAVVAIASYRYTSDCDEWIYLSTAIIAVVPSRGKTSKGLKFSIHS